MQRHQLCDETHWIRNSPTKPREKNMQRLKIKYHLSYPFLQEKPNRNRDSATRGLTGLLLGVGVEVSLRGGRPSIEKRTRFCLVTPAVEDIDVAAVDAGEVEEGIETALEAGELTSEVL